jgi:hypothetical protein
MQNAEMLAETIISAGKPHKDSETRIQRFNFTAVGTKANELAALLDELTSKVTKSQAPIDIQNHRQCLRYILNNLMLCAFRFEWLVLPTTPNSFKQGEYLQSLGFDQRRMKRCIDLLLNENLMFAGRKGHLGGKEAPSKASQFYPTPTFISLACSYLYSEIGSFDAITDEDLYQFKRFDHMDLPSIETYQSKLATLRNYNNFMREHSWAMKSPSHRTVKDFDCRSGRIINHFQNLAERRVKIRTQTLIDGFPISEPDFSANHLRMSAFLNGEEIPEDPYQEIAKSTGLKREQIKRVVTECMGASTLRQKGGLIRHAYLHRIPIHAEQYKVILDALYSNYPWLKAVFFNDYGPRLQYLEGEIALEMMWWATNNEIPLIPVHDAFAVRAQDHDSTFQQMEQSWISVLHQARGEAFITTTQYTTDIVLERNRSSRKGVTGTL